MAKKLRIDKILSNLGYGSRAELKVYCKKGMVKVNDKVYQILEHKLIQMWIK